MDKYDELANRFHLEPGAAEAGRQAAKAGSDAVERRAHELVALGRRMGVTVSLATARIRAVAEAQSQEGGDDGNG
jgi:hypothetical protein